jgi:two-component system CitB family sensor kinase
MLLQMCVIAVVVLAGSALAAWFIDRDLDRQYEQRALAVARTVAADPGLGDLVARHDQPSVQQIALRQAKATGALFVVVTDARGIRLAHPDPQMIGKPVSTDPFEALSGKDVAAIQRGTLGLSARGKVPLRDSSGAIVGEVSVGFDAREIHRSLLHALTFATPYVVGALALGMAGSVLLARLLKRRTLGLEPSELADLVREREAVLYGVSDGVLAVDANGKVTMCNDEASRLLGVDLLPGTPTSELALPARLRTVLGGNCPDTVLAVAGTKVVVASHRPVSSNGRDLGGVLTLRDRTDVEQLTSELHDVRYLTTTLRAQQHEFANRMHTVLGLLESNAESETLHYLRTVTNFVHADEASDAPPVQSATIRALIAAKRSRAGELGVTLDISEQSNVPQRLVAPVEVVTILGNLVDNALDAAHGSTRRPAHVEVDLVVEQAALVISVANTGDGVSPDQAETIFTEGVSTRGSDRGLGLAICRKTAALLGGDVTLADTGHDKGYTVFVARLPEALERDTQELTPTTPL